RLAKAPAPLELSESVRRTTSHVYGEDAKREVANEFAQGMERLVRVAREHGAKALISTVPANLREWRPRRSIGGVVSEADREAWNEAFRAGGRFLAAGDSAKALEALERARALDPGHAETHFLAANALEKLERWDEAREEYERAADLDASPE